MDNIQQRLAGLSPQQRQQLLNKLKSQSKTVKKEKDIVRVDRQQALPLSFAQQRLWFLDQLEKSSQYNEFNATEIQGALDIDLFQRCLQQIISRHEILRTFFPEKQGKASQIIAEHWEVMVSVIDLQHLNGEIQSTQINNEIEKNSLTSFALDTLPLFRFTLIQLAPQKTLFLATLHHIICDYWSGQLFQSELAKLYQNEALPIAPQSIQYVDYADWQHHWLKQTKQAEQLAYWQKQLHDAPELLQLPTDFVRPNVQSFRGQQVFSSLPIALYNDLKSLSKQTGNTLFMLLLAAFSILLAGYSRQQDILIGSALAGRQQKVWEDLLGFFINTLVFRVDLAKPMTVKELLAQVKTTALAAYAHQDIPFEQIVEVLQPGRNLSHSPLFQVMFVLQNMPVQAVELPNIKLQPYPHQVAYSKFDLSLEMIQTATELNCVWHYATDLFTKKNITMMTIHFQQILQSMVANPSGELRKLSWFSEKDKQCLIQWNQTTQDYPAQTLIQLFEQQVLATPDKTALIVDHISLSYKQLNHRINQWAHYIIDQQYDNESLIAVMLLRSVDMVVALYAVLKAGCAYVPIDPNLPKARIGHMLTDSAAVLLLTTTDLLPQQVRCQTVCMDRLLLQDRLTNPELAIKVTQLAYVIYTSGSTGQPKGAMNQHNGVVNRLLWMQDQYQLSDTDRILQKTPFNFDVSVWEFFWPLLNGACLVMAKPEAHKDPVYLLTIIQTMQISIVHFVPSMLPSFLQVKKAHRLPSLRHVICSGEALSNDLLQRFFQSFVGQQVQCHNLYGPTEAAIDVSYWLCQNEPRYSAVPIGKPVANTQLYVLNEANQCLPVGIAGELCIAGVQVGRGYLQDELSAEKYTEIVIFGKKQRIYRTGDLARWSAEGHLIYLGRLDHQIKLRGFRIELGEIEAKLLQFEALHQVVVLLSETDQLIAYYCSEVQLSSELLDEFLGQQLPEYMIPTHFVNLPEMPLNANGKIDRQALIQVTVPKKAIVHFVAPRNEQERLLQSIWQSVLQYQDTISVFANFFALGGHSLLATQVVSRVCDEFSVKVALRQLFEAPTIAAFVNTINTSKSAKLPKLTKLSINEQDNALSFAQERLWFLDQLEGQNAVYNIPVALQLQGDLDLAALQMSFDAIIDRHEILRTEFVAYEGKVRQLVKPEFSLLLAKINISSLNEAEQAVKLKEELQLFARRPFDLSRLPLWRSLLIQCHKTSHVLAIVWHHTIFDAWSGDIFMAEFSTFYKAFKQNKSPQLAELPIQYVDYSTWQRTYLSQTLQTQQLAYWQQQLANAPPLLNLATDYGRPLKLRFQGKSHQFTLPKTLTENLQQLAQTQNSTLFMLLLSVYAILLQRYSAQDDIVIGSPIANRQHPDVEPLLGFFVNTLALRIDLSQSIDFSDLLAQVKETCLQAYQHQDVPFEQIVETLQPERNPGHTPLYQVMFAWQDALGQPALQWPDLELRSVAINTATARCDLSLLMRKQDQQLEAYFEYNSDLFAPITIARMAQHFNHLLTAIVANPKHAIQHLPLLSQEQWYTQFRVWNETSKAYPKQHIDAIFRQQVQHYPDNIALIFEQHKLTYAALDQQVNNLAQHLQKIGALPQDFIALAAARSLEMIVGVLAILRVGGVYVALESELPAQQVAYMITDAKIALILSQQALISNYTTYDVPIVNLNLTYANTETFTAPNINIDDLAYVSYTSGTTGKPKGVCIRQRGVLRLVKNNNFMTFDPTQVFLQFAPLAFDASTLEIWGPLLNAGCLVIMPPNMPSLARLGKVISEQKVTTLWLTAGLFLLMVDECLEDLKSLRQLLAGGDVLSVPHVKKALERLPHCQLINGYGPTENTTFTTCYRISAEQIKDTIPIGYAIANSQIFILDKYQQLLPVGVPGELYIGGDGLAQGYLNAPELTAEKFITVTFIAPNGETYKQRLYKTGDRVRYQEQGLVEFLGRIDQQVKIRGFRVEPGLTESVLLQHPFVREACVLIHENDSAEKQLVAYVTLKSALKSQALLLFLQKQLARYQLPDHICILDVLPLNQNGKINRTALPLPEYQSTVEFKAPENETQSTLHQLFVNLFHFNVEQATKLGVTDDFFAMGGHSLLATQLVSQIRRIFGLEMPLRIVFEQPTIEALAAYIMATKTSDISSLTLKPVQAKDRLPLSFAQKRLWFLNQLEPDNPFYNVALALLFKGQLNIEVLEKSIETIVQRHSVLRTQFSNDEGQPHLITREHAQQCPLLVRKPCDLHSIEAQVAKEAKLPFDLAQDDLLRTTLLTIDSQQSVLLVTIHHSVADGWSLGILVDELLIAYPALLKKQKPRLATLPISYADFAYWQRQWLSGDTLKRQLNYWKKQLHGVSPVLQFPTDYARPKTQSFRGDSCQFTLDKSLTLGLQALTQQSGGTLFMTLLSAFSVLLYRYSDQSDMVIGTPIANRNRAEIEPLIGFFVNTLALRIDLADSPDFITLLQSVRETALEAYSHQDLPFEKLIDELNIERDLSRNPLFQVMFAMQNVPLKNLHFPEVAIEAIDVPHSSALFDLVLDIWPADEGLIGVLQYSTDLFKRTTIEALIAHYQKLLEQVVATPECAINALPMLSPEEQRILLTLGNGAKRAYPVQKTIHQLFETQVKTTPKRIAVVHYQRQINYLDLNKRANQIAAKLLLLGVQAGQCIGILEERGIDLVAAILAVLKTGCAFLPIDPVYPQDRIEYMIDNSETLILISRTDLMACFDLKVSCLNLDDRLLDMQSIDNPNCIMTADNWAYMLYTSGSTGLPKGTIIRHDGAINHMFAEFDALAFHFDSAFLQSAPSSSDISVWQLLASLMLGGRTVIIDFDTVCEVSKLFMAIKQYQVTLIELVPVVLQSLLDYAATLPPEERSLPHLEWAMVTGEAVSAALINQWLATYTTVKLVNAYGPTEAADDVCQSVFSQPLAEQVVNVSIGKPLANLSLMLVDNQLQLRPRLVAGEICVSGIGIGAGYWKHHEKTKRHFVDNPFLGNYGQVMYRTGDLGRWLDNGSLEFLGRIDQQVKIRGFRIELGEIEGVINQCEAIKEAVVLTHQGNTEKQLVAYLQTDKSRQQQVTLQQEQVDLWTTLHEDSYSDSPSHDDLSFNIVGWDSNYTGKQLSDAQMQEYVQHTVQAILALQPKNILEIGCGTGLLMYRLVPHCQHYLGTDLSAVALKRLQDSKPLLKIAGLVEAEFLVNVADDFSPFRRQYYDTIVINSVLQYFPDSAYLLTVIRGCLDILTETGSIFIGDVRHYGLQQSYHASVQAYKADQDIATGALWKQIEQQLSQDQELYIAPAFFRQLVETFSEIKQVDIRPKRGQINNEMTRFRYDVVLHVGASKVLKEAQASLKDWTTTTIEDFLNDEKPDYLLLKKVNNARLSKEKQLMLWLKQATETHFESWLAKQPQSTDFDPEYFYQLPSNLAYQVSMQIDLDDPYCYDVLLQRDNKPMYGLPKQLPEQQAWQNYVNDPLQEKFDRQVLRTVRQWINDKLPNYMMPSSFIILAEFPLLPNGKIDRNTLPEPDLQTERLGALYQPAHTEIEHILVRIWGEVLGLDKIGIQDNFFELGGHSLKATQVVSKIHKLCHLEVTLREIFSHTTVAQLAVLLDSRQHSEYQMIRPAPPAEHYALSHAQRRLWVLAQIDPESVAYHMTEALLFTGNLHFDALQDAYRKILQRHEILRSCILMVNNEPRQKIIETPQNTIDILTAETDIQQQALAYLNTPFVLQKGPLLRLGLMALPANKTLLLFSMHHIISDGWSMDILVSDFLHYYQKLPQKSPLPIQYKDYAAWQNQLLLEASVVSHQRYWLNTLAGELPILNLPTDFVRPRVKGYLGQRYDGLLNKTLSTDLQTFAQQQQSSLFMLLLALVKVVFFRYTEQQDIIVGSPVAGRDHSDLEAQIGFYVNTLALRSQLQSDKSFSDYLAEIKQITLAAYTHQIYPFDRLVHDLKIPRDVSRTPLFDVMVVLQNTTESSQIPGIAVEAYALESIASQFDMTLSFSPTEAGIELSIWYNRDLFIEARIQRMAQHLQTIAEAVLKQPKTCLGQLPMLSAVEKQALRQHTPPIMEAMPKNLVAWFGQQVKQNPNAVALSFAEQQLSYQQLNQRANQLAHLLIAQGVGGDCCVGLSLSRSLPLIISILAILKTGATYVPLDPDYPEQRLTFMSEDAKINTLIDAQYMTQYGDAISDHSLKDPEVDISPQQIAYIIYTSGSTGQPKGVQVTHFNVVRLLQATQPWYQFNEQDVWTLFHSYAFDFSVWEIWGALLYGGRLVIVPYLMSRSPEDFYQLLVDEKVTVLNQTPSAFQSLQRVDTGLQKLALRYVIFGGEALEMASLKPWFDKHGDERPQLINMYGITETTVHVTYRPLSRADLQQKASIIGEAIPDLQLRVLDKNGEMMPIGVPGELHVGGAGVSAGYLNRPELNAQRFIVDKESKARFYRTGDLVRYLENRELEYLGRIDNQVKVRGFRIELAEIEAVCKTHEAITQCLVLLDETSQLVAYYISSSLLENQSLHHYLQQYLPDYMIPATFMAVSAWPTTPSGKIDHKALLALEQTNTRKDYAPPENEMEETISDVWQGLLNQSNISVESNLFEIGAHSLLIIQAQTELVSRLQREIPVVQLFKYPTIRALADYLNEHAKPLKSNNNNTQERARKRLENRKRRQRKNN